GPNNSGKSLLLREIERDISSHQQPDSKILKNLIFGVVSKAEAEKAFARLQPRPAPDTGPQYVSIRSFHPGGVNESGLIPENIFENLPESRSAQWLKQAFHRHFLIRLDGRTRFDLTNDMPRDDLVAPAQNILGQLFRDDGLRKNVRDIVHDAFGLYFVI